MCTSFPTLYAVATSKGAKVGEVWESTRGGGGWNLRFIKPFNDWELEETQRLISLNSSRNISQGEKDKIFWLVDKKGQYTVKANYRHHEGDLSGSIPTSLIWNNCVPPKVSVFTWEVRWGKVLTMDQLKKRGFQLASRCPMCKEDEENIDHLLLHCPLVWGFWAALISL